MTSTELSQVFLPKLLSDMFRARIPATMADDIDWKRLMPMDGSAIREPVLDALRRLSQLDLSRVADELLNILPPLDSSAFPEQALGALFLLDQGPRQFLEGIDERWQAAVFDPLATAFARQLYALPKATRPYTKERWVKEQGWDVEHWVPVQLWYTAALVHSEDKEDHKIAVLLEEEVRQVVEQETNSTDPFRADMDEDRKQPDLFMKRAIKGPPQGNVSMKEAIYWFLNILWVHEPIIDTFGRYPYRNSIVGRTSTASEVQFLEDTDHFGEVDETVAAHVLQDVKTGRWTPLASSGSLA